MKTILLNIIAFLVIITLQAQKIKTVVIDAGHGGKDPGAVCFGLKEKDITLSVALKLGELIKKYNNDINVVYTRKTDEFIELYKRAKIANNAKADLFISIHVNSNKKPDPYGSETYVMGLSKTDENLEVAMTENAVILKEEDYKNQYEGFDPRSPEAYIIFSLYQNANLDLSLHLASLIQEEYQKVKRENRGVKQAGFLVLWKTTMPSILTEIGFISNKEEADFLANENNHWLIAKSIYNGFIRYRSYIEKTNYSTLSKKDLPEIKEEIKPEDNKQKKEIDNITINNTDNKDTVNYDFQKIAEAIVDKYEQKDTILFWVQIASSDKPISLSKFSVDNVNELVIDNTYKYAIGPYFIYQQGVEKQKEVRKKYPDAFIIATKNGKKIPITDAMKKTKS